MFNKPKKTFRSYLLLLIFSLGISSAHPDCYNPLSNLCLQANLQNSAEMTLISVCVDTPCHMAFFSNTKGDYCCEENSCNYEGNNVYGNQSSKNQTHDMVFFIAGHACIQRFTQLKLTPNQYKFTKITPIYILTQSILC